MLSSLTVPFNYLVRREVVPLSESDALQSDDSASLTSQHADFIIAWATVEGNILSNTP